MSRNFTDCDLSIFTTLKSYVFIFPKHSHMQTSLRSPAAVQCRRAASAAPTRLICRPVLPARVKYVHARAAGSSTERVVTGPSASTVTPQAVQTQVQASPAVAPSLQQKLSSFLRSTAKAAAILGVAMALVLGNVNPAHAARSAGRAGGFSAPSSRSYGGGGGGYSGGMSRGYSGGYTGYSGGYSTYRAPIIVPSPYMSPVYPGTGMMVSPGAAVVTTGPGIVDIAIVSMFLVMAASAASTALKGGVDGDDYDGGYNQPTLTRVQVGLVSLARELKGDLDRIAARADTGSSQGLHQLLQEVALALLRNPKYCIYGAASQKSCSSTTSLESSFNSASVKERSKFEQETLVNVGGSNARRSSYKPSAGSSRPDELVVVTMLVATGCKVDVPAKINSLADLKQALEALGGLPQDQVLGVELLWTPQAEGDFYTRDEIVTDYPHLRQL